MKRLFLLLVALGALNSWCVFAQKDSDNRMGMPKELESKMFDSYGECYDYLLAPIDSANRANLPNRCFVIPKRCVGNEQLERLVDAYNITGVMCDLRNVVEECMRFFINKEDKIKRVDCGVVKNAEIVVELEDLKNKALAFCADLENLETGAAFWNTYWEMKEKVSIVYGLNSFTNLTEEVYNERMNFANYVPEIDSLNGFTCTSDSAYLKDRIWSIAECEDITAKCIHAHLYLYAAEHMDSEFLPILEYIMEKKEATPMLSVIWRYWRCRYQTMMGGISKDSNIFNDYYNVRRLECAKVIFDYIEQNPTDGVMINEFLILATTDDIFRYGDFEYGNQVVIEEYNLLPMCGFQNRE